MRTTSDQSRVTPTLTLISNLINIKVRGYSITESYNCMTINDIELSIINHYLLIYNEKNIMIFSVWKYTLLQSGLVNENSIDEAFSAI